MEEDNEEQYILSLCWDSSLVAAVYYNLSTLELHVKLKLSYKLTFYNKFLSIFR